jgi:hypothetical protein
MRLSRGWTDPHDPWGNTPDSPDDEAAECGADADDVDARAARGEYDEVAT